MKYSGPQFLWVVSYLDTAVGKAQLEKFQQLQSTVLILYGQVE